MVQVVGLDNLTGSVDNATALNTDHLASTSAGGEHAQNAGATAHIQHNLDRSMKGKDNRFVNLTAKHALMRDNKQGGSDCTDARKRARGRMTSLLRENKQREGWLVIPYP